MQPSPGFAHFLAQADPVARLILAAMLIMSFMTWFLVVSKGLKALAQRRASERFLAAFRAIDSLEHAEALARGQPPSEPFGALVEGALLARRQHRERLEGHGMDDDTEGECVARALRRAIDESAMRAESGLTLLASIGSSAPFIGLFGTVWGIYHALVAIGTSGQGSLDQVAGPVGEALIMTAIGLAVAIPAVIAYNGLTRRNRLLQARLDSFSHDVFTLLATGRPPIASFAASPRRGPAAAVAA